MSKIFCVSIKQVGEEFHLVFVFADYKIMDFHSFVRLGTGLDDFEERSPSGQFTKDEAIAFGKSVANVRGVPFLPYFLIDNLYAELEVDVDA